MFRIARTFYGVKGFRRIEAWSPLSSADPGVLRKLARSAPWHRALRRGGYTEGATQRGEVILGLGGRALSVTGGRWWRAAICRGGWWLGHKSARRECMRPVTPLSLEDALQLADRSARCYNHERLHSAIGYVTPEDKLEGREASIFAECTQVGDRTQETESSTRTNRYARPR